MNPLVSILIPAYNAAPWLADAVRSAQVQTWPRKEIIIVDDGSRDETLAVARTFAGAEVKVLTHKNQGASRTRSRALAEAQGDYIQWLDADDLLDPDKIACQLQHADDDSVLLSSAWGRFYFRPHKAVFRENALCRDHTPVGWLQTKMESNAWMAIESWLVSRRLTTAAGPWDPTLTADDDGDYFARVVAASSAVRYIPGARSRIRLANPHSLSKGVRSPRWLASQFRSLSNQIHYLRGLDDNERTRRAAVALLRRWAVYFYPGQPELYEAAARLAGELGAELPTPRLHWKYRWLEPVIGPRRAQALQLTLPTLRAWFARTSDRLLHSLRF